jgi:predicted GIY-YIG superfamily endonuclease
MSLARYSVYVLENPQGRLYVGVTDNAARRTKQHNDGVSNWTRGKGPWTMVWEKGGLTLSEARKLELKLKRQKGGGGFYRMTGLKRGRGS